MALPDRASEIRQLEQQMAQWQAQIDALAAPPSGGQDTAQGTPVQGGSPGGALWRAEEALRTAEAIVVPQVPVDEAESGEMVYGDEEGAAKAKKAKVDKAKDAIKAAKASGTALAKQIVSATARRNTLVDQERTAQNNPLTPDETAALAADLTRAQANARTAEANATVAEAEVGAATAKALADADPANVALKAAAAAADLALTEAQTVAQGASAAAAEARTAADNYDLALKQALEPTTLRSAEATTTTLESQAIRDAALANHAEQLAQAEADIQSGNATWQEIQNRLALLEEDTARQLLAAGMPQIEIDTALADLKAKDIANQQMDEGELVTRLTQMRDAIEAGTMTEAQGDLAAEELFSGATQFQRQQQVDSNTQNAINQAAAGGYLVGPNQKTTDPFGMLGSTFESMGMPGQSQQPISPLTVPNWLKATGQTSTADPRKTFAPGGQFYGENGLPAWADTSQGLDIGPEEWKQMQGEQVVQKVAGAAEAAAPPPVVPPAAAAPSTPVTVNITVPGGDPANNTPPPPAGIPAVTGPTPEQQRMAQSVGPDGRPLQPVNVPPPVMPSGGGGSVAPPAPPPAAPPTVGPKTNPGPAYVPKGPDAAPPPSGGPLPGMGMQKFGPQPPLQVPRWMRSAQFAGGR